MSEKLSYFGAIRFLSKYIRKHRQNFFMFYFGWLFDSILSIAMPILFGIMIDEIVYYQNVRTFVIIAVLFVVLTVFSCMMYFFIYAQHSYLMNMYVFDIRKDLFTHLQKCDAQYMSGLASGDFITTIQRYSMECMHFVIRNMIHTTNYTLMIIAYSVYLLFIDWRIGIFAIMAAPVSTYINTKFGKKIRSLGDAQREHYGVYSGWIFEVLSALRDIRVLNAKSKVDELFENNHKKMFSTAIQSRLKSITAENIISFSNLTIQMSIFLIAGYSAIWGNTTVGLLTIIISFYASLTSLTNMLSSTYLDAQDRISYIQRIYDFLHSPTEDTWTGSIDLTIKDGNIKFEGITFSYEGQEATINNLNLIVGAGERFALIGKSGGGKTTLAYMLVGFYRPQYGSISIDEQKLMDCNLKSIRNGIGLVRQDVLLFDGTIRENVLFGKLNASEADVIDACKSAGLWSFIESLPAMLDTVVGTKGVNVSGGQKQRIAIARIYLKNPKIIIFDEATSSLDDETEAVIHEAWTKVLAGRTSIIIAHRQSSVMLCDRAAIIDNGHIIEIGAPNEMAQKSENFKTLFAINRGEVND